MLKKSPITKKWYSVETLTLEKKLALGFPEDAKEELEIIPEEEKKSPAKKRKRDDD